MHPFIEMFTLKALHKQISLQGCAKEIMEGEITFHTNKLILKYQCN